MGTTKQGRSERSLQTPAQGSKPETSATARQDYPFPILLSFPQGMAYASTSSDLSRAPDSTTAMEGL
jgi:hypothetical protein